MFFLSHRVPFFPKLITLACSMMYVSFLPVNLARIFQIQVPRCLPTYLHFHSNPATTPRQSDNTELNGLSRNTHPASGQLE